MSARAIAPTPPPASTSPPIVLTESGLLRPPPRSLAQQLSSRVAASGLNAISTLTSPVAEELRLLTFQRELPLASPGIELGPDSNDAWRYIAYSIVGDAAVYTDPLMDRILRGEIAAKDHPLAVRAIARHAPERLEELVKLPEFLTPDTAHAFALFTPDTHRAQLFEKLLSRLDVSKWSIAIAADPAIVAARLRNRWDDGLLSSLNFVEDDAYPDDVRLLEAGFWFVGPHLRTTSDPDGWRQWIDYVFENPEQLAANANPGVLDGIGRELLIHKIRHHESELLKQDATRDSLPARTMTRRIGEYLMFTPGPLFRHFSANGIELAGQSKAAQFTDRILVETIRYLQQPHARLRLHRELEVKAFWHSSNAVPRDQVEAVSAYGPHEQDVASILRRGVMTPVRFPRKLIYDSPGAKAASQFAGHFSLDLSIPLAREEQRALSDTGRCGCEVQIDLLEHVRHQVYSYKAALRSLGLTVPVRSGTERIVEVAHPPSASWLPQLVTFGLLERFGLPQKAHELTVHVSAEGDLRDESRYIAFPQLLTTWATVKSTSTRPLYRSMGRLLSKGLVHRNSDTVPVGSGEHPVCRTEFRIIRGGGTRTFQSVLQSTFDTLQLANACTSSRAELKAAWQAYKEGVDRAVASMPDLLAELFACDWYEASGDAFDYEITCELGVYKLLDKIRSAHFDFAHIAFALEPHVRGSVREAARQMNAERHDWTFLNDCRLGFLIPEISG